MNRDWNRFSAHWPLIASPLRPTPEGVARVAAALAGHDERVLMLGVTPELAVLGRDLTAVDSSPGMIAAVWPGDAPDRRAVLGDWLDLSFPDGHFSAVLADGAFIFMRVPEGLRRLLASVRRVLAPGGLAVFRTFCTPEQPETLEEVQRALAAGEIANFHALKWRIAMAQEGAAQEGPEHDPHIRTPEILARFETLFPDRDAFLDRTGWPAEEVATIDAYRDSDQTYVFAKQSRLVELMEAEGFGIEVRSSGDYPLAERCPLVVFST